VRTNTSMGRTARTCWRSEAGGWRRGAWSEILGRGARGLYARPPVEMGEAVFAIVISWLIGLAAATGRAHRLVLLHDPIDPDLPCPWCRTYTFEDDTACPGCGRHFG